MRDNRNLRQLVVWVEADPAPDQRLSYVGSIRLELDGSTVTTYRGPNTSQGTRHEFYSPRQARAVFLVLRHNDVAASKENASDA